DKKVEEIIKEIEDNKNDGIITEEEAEELINKVASKSEISKDKVDNQTTKEDVENIKNDALQEIDNITNIEKIIDNKKEEAKEELNKKKEEAIELINSIKYASVSNAIKEDIITEIGNIKTNGDTAIDLAKDKEEIKNTLEEYIQKINDEIKKVDEALEFIEYKEQVKDDLNDIIEETKENIKNISSITDEEKENLYEELEKIKDKFPQFDTLDKKEDVENLMEELIKDIEKVSTTAEVLDAKEKAKEQIDEEAKKEIKRDITKNEYLTEEEKNEFITKINEEATKAKAEIDKQEIDTIEKINNEVEKYKNTLDDISIEIQNKNNFYIEKEEIKVLIDNKAQKAKESIQNNKLLTEEEKIDYIQKVEQIRIDKNNEVDNKTYDMYEANNNILKEIKNDAYTQIDEILNEIKENTSIKSKIEEAIIELEEVKDIIKEAIENNDNLTNYEKNYYDKLLDDAFNDGENNIKNSKTEEEIKEALEKAKEELQNIANNADTVIAVSTPSESEKPNDEEEEESTPSEIIKTLEEEKQDAISNINKEKEEVIKEINDNNTLTDEEKEIYIKEVNDIVDKAIEDINNTQDKDTVSDIMKDAIEDLDDINDKANLNHKKDEIKKEIEKEANDLKDYIENTDDKILDPSKKQELKDQIDNIVNNKNNEIDQKETIYEIEKIFDEAKKELNDIKDLISEKEDFENKKEEAIKEIEKEINDLKDKINEAFDKGELTEEKKQELEEDLDKVLEDATNQINNSTTEEEINQNKQDALDKITNVENETFLQNEKDKAKEALERAIIDAMGKVFEEFDNNNITTSEKDELISNLQNIRTDGIASLNNTNSIQEVKESLDEFIGTTNDHKNSKIGDVLDKLQEIIDFKNFKEEIEKKLNDKIEEAKKEIIDKKIVEDDTNRLIEVLSNLKATSSNALKDQNTAEEVINTKNEANKIIEDTLNEANDIYNFLKIKEEAKKEIENKKDEILDLIEEDTFITDEEKQELKEKIASISNAYLEKIENDTLAEEVNIDKSEAITNLENTFKEEKNKRFDERKSVFLNDLREFTDRVKKAVDDDELVLEPKKVELKDGLEEEYVLASKRIEDIDKQNLNLYATEVLEKQVKTAKAAIVNVVVNFVKVIPEGKGGGNIEVVNEEKGPTSTTPDIEQGDVVIPGEDEPYETFPIHENIAIGAGGLGRMMLSSKASLTISSEDDQGNRTAKLHNTDLFNNTIFVTYKSDADDDTKYDDGYIAYATDENFIILTGWIYTTSGEVLFASVEDNENKGELYTGLKAIGKYYYYFNTSQNSYGSLVKSKYDSVSMISNGVYVNNEGKICTQDGTLITVK
ncbi:MAG: DUF1542 domain-containing protein, partial [Eubacteriales bacterium]|nr:DUF1542 domain-containing protein [Eubacteriales bacterium]